MPESDWLLVIAIASLIIGSPAIITGLSLLLKGRK